MTNLDIDYIVQARRNHAPRAVIAEICGVTTGALKRFMVSKGIDDNKHNRLSMPETKGDRLARRKGFKNLTDAVRYYRQGKKPKSLKFISVRFGVSINTVERHNPPELRGKIFVKSEKWRKATAQNLKKAQDKNRKHHISGKTISEL